MAMTETEYEAWDYLCTKLRDGYKEYADILLDLHLNLTDDPDTTAFLDPRTATITVNIGFDENQVLAVVRHEIMHHWLKHELRLIKHAAQIFRDKGYDINPDDLTEMNIKQLKKFIYKNKVFNIAGDYEISNLTYGDYEKDVFRHLLLNGKELTCLVTEDDHPDWVNLSLEEMYDKLLEEMKKNSLERKGTLVDETTFIDEKGRVYGV